MDHMDRPAGGKVRNTGIDALRICSMLMVTVLHVLRHGGILNMTDVLSQNGLTGQYMTAWFLEIASYSAVDCFALISGYVGVTGKYRYSNLVVQWLQVVFYGVGIAALFTLFQPGTVVKTNWLNAVFPVSHDTYWYFTAYVGLFLFMPLLNAAINQLGKRQLTAIVIAFVLMFSVFPTARSSDLFKMGAGYSVWWLMVLYTIGGYIRKYGLFKKCRPGWMFGGYLITVILTWCTEMAKRTELYFPGESLLFVDYTSPLVMASGVFLLLGFERLRVPERLGRCVRFLSPLAFSAYLIGDNPMVRGRLMNNRFSMQGVMPPLKEAAAVVGTAAAIYAACTLVDLLRAGLFKALRVRPGLNALEGKLRELAGRRGEPPATEG